MLKFKYIVISAAILLMVLLVLEPLVFVSVWWYVLLFSTLFWILLIGSFSMGWGLFLKAFTSNASVKEKKIAITFDDGPNAHYTPKVLQLLKDYDAKATFFCIGKQVEKHPGLLKQIHEGAHCIGNHSYSHSSTIDFKSTEEWLMELKNTDKAIFEVLEQQTTLFRPPYGVTTPHLAKALKVTGHNVIGWNNRSFDMAIKNPEMVIKRTVKKIKPGSVILLHDKHERIETILEQLLQFLKTQEYQMVTIKELMNEK
ncbi:MAG TPA: polysaccharide deacetylase family protein [Aquaticitalea sp.]|nr:polysaccharide deacetylase family protein [Aquaticitalea sp.]